MLDTCPREWAAEMFSMMRYADMCRRGLPPISGGALDQAAWFLDACSLVWCEESYWRAKAGMTDVQA